MSLNLRMFSDTFNDVDKTKMIVGSVIGLYAGYTIYSWYCNKKYINTLKRKVKARQQIRNEQIARIQELTKDLDPELEKKIGSLGIQKLLESLKSGVYSCTDVLKVYQKRALHSQELTNCITEFILEANATAQEYDKLRGEPGYELPPLFGLPISVKSNISFKGKELFYGYVQDLEIPMQVDSVIVEHLQELGAIPFVLTNVPQTLMAYSCENPVYGSTCHPMSKERTSGGSSGGEAALVATGGSIVGIGSDTGGSVRIPAAFCGCVGFKPYSKRVSTAGDPGSVPGRSHCFGAAGPIAADVQSCVEIMRAFWSEKWIHEKDAYVAPIDFDEEMYGSKKKLRIGFFDTNDVLEPVPAMKRAVHETCKRLENLGHEIVEFKPPDMQRAFQLFMMAVTLDNGQFIMNRWDKDLPGEGYREMLFPLRWPFWFRRFMSRVLYRINKRASEGLGSFHTTTRELLAVYKEIEAYWITWKKLMREQNLDCLICPIFPVVAMKHKEPYKITFNCSYTSLFNLLDYPAGTVPVTHVSQNDVDEMLNYKARDYFERLLVRSSKGTLGYPVGVQVVSLPYRDEMVLRVMREIEESVKKDAA